MATLAPFGEGAEICSPRERFAEVEEAPGGAVVGKGGEGGAGFASFAELHGGLGAAHVGFYPAGMRGVDLDFGVAEFVGEVDGEGVQRGFGGVVGEGFAVVDGGFGVGLQGEGAEDAGEVKASTDRNPISEPLGLTTHLLSERLSLTTHLLSKH